MLSASTAMRAMMDDIVAFAVLDGKSVVHGLGEDGINFKT
jgi:hypothetical protein